MNLLSKRQKELLHKEVRFKFLVALFSMLTFLVAIFAVLEYAMVLYVKVQMPAIDERIASAKATETSKSVKTGEEEIKILNDMLERINLIEDLGNSLLPRTLILIGEIMPEGGRLEKFSFSGYNISLSGHADKRLDILELKTRLEKEDFCKNLTAPIIPLKEEDVDFSFGCDEEFKSSQ